jgi:hypothetical protein
MHRHRQLRTYYPESTLSNASFDPQISCWTDPPFILTKLLPFGKVTYPWDYSYFQDITLNLTTSAA